MKRQDNLIVEKDSLSVFLIITDMALLTWSVIFGSRKVCHSKLRKSITEEYDIALSLDSIWIR